MTSRLPDETFVAICGFGILNRDDLENVMLVSKRFNRIAWSEVCPDLYSEISIESPRLLHRLLRSVIRNPSLGPLIKQIILDWSNEEDSPQVCEGSMELLEQVEAAKLLLPPVVADHPTGQSAPAAQALLLLALLPTLRLLAGTSLRPSSFTEDQDKGIQVKAEGDSYDP
ncbi:SubName: Full=Uncharacterized protein {ECO:0000313/EMBL:CCA74029.1} [Serendipita indica DSM 11827]|nr:SubName: Full=Uncharacterized protein {ECO:0000313/EMBL:CCA74029.1} [Serendipita indica DSM 11827]